VILLSLDSFCVFSVFVFLSAECFEDGWFLTGDVGMWRNDGNLQIIDRKKVKLIAVFMSCTEVDERVFFWPKKKSAKQMLCQESNIVCGSVILSAKNAQ